ncbi:tail fiber assembly protein [Pantoea ananatis]|uniref:tail fiber assembly protein n=1 Tax=Pantoea ananas TaxID=553 RepID=UPI000D72F57C|nr:tail fiber assembly protein [Pantoea ananatis]AWQ18491.1 tail fiber assembly protein [Pantoea ananatis]
MKFIYSARQNLFYALMFKDDYVKAGSWPDDAVEVEESVSDEFNSNPPEGKMRVADSKGNPSWADVPPPSKEELINTATSKQTGLIQEANAFMNNRQWPGKAVLGRLKGDDLAAYNKWLDYLDALYATDLSKAPDVSWPAKPDS